MIVDYFDVESITVLPNEAKAPLIVDANTVLATALSAEGLQAVTGWCHQIPEFGRAIQLPQFSLGNAFDATETPAGLAPKNPLRLLAAKRFDHCVII
jgi:hypothetical protein